MSQRDGALDLLKWLALLAMVLDHLRYVGFSADWLYVPGRLAFPWFCLAMAVNLSRSGMNAGQGRYLGRLLLFSAISEIPYRLFFPDPATFNVMPTLVLGWLVARGWQLPTLQARCLAVGALMLAALFSSRLMFGFFGVLLPLAMLLVLRRPWYLVLLPGIVCVAANQWRVLYGAAWLGDAVALWGLLACLLAPGLGLWLLRQAGRIHPPAMRRWAYALYPAHFLILLAVRQAAA
ncbi:TraX family protein [Pseudomonas sp. RGM2987]|uniref:TraX family protein n=1 Tax=Pseudomonas sp. RGM2987 TaxID=2930090 RepID=UPI001FD6F024|nr:TraX family protein [Pseudomonas sp. RGM2987]MCJ8206708.1 conjugal transfer protein TraX [Pseudomonas sp. RGM2987]